MVRNFSANELPLTYLVIDMEWHKTSANPPPEGQKGCNSGTDPGQPREYHCEGSYGGFNWDRTQTPDPEGFQRWIHAQNLSLMLNVHDQCGYDRCQRGYNAIRQAVPGMAALPANTTVPCQFENPALQDALFTHMLESGETAGVDAWWTDLGDMSKFGNWSTWAPGTNENWRCLDDTPPTGNGTRDLFTPAVSPPCHHSCERASTDLFTEREPFCTDLLVGVRQGVAPDQEAQARIQLRGLRRARAPSDAPHRQR